MGTKTLHLAFHLKSKPKHGKYTFDVDVVIPYEDTVDPRVAAELQEEVSGYVSGIRDKLDQHIETCDGVVMALYDRMREKLKVGKLEEKEFLATKAHCNQLLDKSRDFVRKEEADVKAAVPKIVSDFWAARKADEASIKSSKRKAIVKCVANIIVTVTATAGALAAGITAAAVGGPPGWLAGIGLFFTAVKFLKSSVNAVKAVSVSEVKLRADLVIQLDKAEKQVEAERKAGPAGFSDKVKKLFATNEVKALTKLVEAHRLKLVELRKSIEVASGAVVKTLEAQDKLKKLAAASGGEMGKRYEKGVEVAEGKLAEVLKMIDKMNADLYKKADENKKCVVFLKSVHDGKPISAKGLAEKGNEIFEAAAHIYEVVEGVHKIMEAIH